MLLVLIFAFVIGMAMLGRGASRTRTLVTVGLIIAIGSSPLWLFKSAQQAWRAVLPATHSAAPMPTEQSLSTNAPIRSAPTAARARVNTSQSDNADSGPAADAP